jgi:hypothetical protein
MKKNAYIFAIIFIIISIISYFLPWFNNSGRSFGFYLFIFSDAGFLISILIARFGPEEEEETPIISNTPVQKEVPVDDISLLNDLKAKGVLSPEEYDKKILQVEDSRKNANFNSKLKEKTEPMLKPLIELKEKGLLSDEEFNNKKNEIIETQTKLVKEWCEWVDNKSKISVISPDILNTLNENHRNQLERCLNNMKITDIIAFHDATVKIIDAERWGKINEQGVADKFRVIYKWNS